MHDIIISPKVTNGSEPAFPWMVDGAGVSTNAAQLLTDLVNALDTFSYFPLILDLYCILTLYGSVQIITIYIYMLTLLS